MTKIQKLMSPKQQFFFAHGLQSAVVDIIYEKRDN